VLKEKTDKILEKELKLMDHNPDSTSVSNTVNTSVIIAHQKNNTVNTSASTATINSARSTSPANNRLLCLSRLL
jgi:hypothetical protein